MTEITASMVKNLRERTDAPMMDCKKALSEAAGDMTRAEEILRVRFGNKASKAAGRVTAEGLVAISLSTDGKMAAMIEVNSETDFCAKNQDFVSFVKVLAEVARDAQPANIETLSGLQMPDGMTVEDARTQLIGKIGENITLRRLFARQAQGKLTSYIHGGGKIGVLVDIVGGDDVLAKDIAMHIAAARPRALNASGIDATVIDAERRIAIEKAQKSGKSQSMLEKIAEGTVQKFLKDVTLLSQSFVKNDQLTIEQLLKSKGAQAVWFGLYAVGEGIEKVVTNYAAEVAATVAAAKV
ncbi:MAG: translation elongation factor Ts [Methylophilaceae bacterium]|nr:translation elongation factor Ts [Methylophilaceae bacterium]